MTKSFASDFINSFNETKFTDEILLRFDVLLCLAQNEYGETFLLSEKNSGKRYVIKCYNKTGEINAVHEGELLRGLKHNGLPNYETEIENDNALFVLREYIDGIPLDRYLSEHQPDEAQTVNIIIELCDILLYLHSQSSPIIHRDIKPSNIIINPKDKKLTLIDFGISRKYSDETNLDTTFSGTQEFAPPEQYGFLQTDCRADIYALGVVMRFMLIGTTDKNAKIDNKPLGHIVSKCMAFSPDKRFKSVSELKKALINYSRQTNKKILFALNSLLIASFVFTIGFLFGRYTNILDFQSKISNEEIYSFKDSLIESAVRLTLDKEPEEQVYRNELKHIKNIYIVGETAVITDDEYHELRFSFSPENNKYGTISDLSDLSEMKNLQYIRIMAQPFSDLAPLSANVQLRKIELVNCNVSDVTALTNLPYLYELEIIDCEIMEFSAFQNIKTLKRLGIAFSPLSYLSELGNIFFVESIDLNNTLLTNLDGIENFSNLTELSIANTEINDFSALISLPYLQKLQISKDMEKYLDTLENKNVEIIYTS